MTRLGIVSLALLALAGCEDSNKRLNAPPHGYPQDQTAEMQGTFTYMVDNAMLADMTITDAHFYPHRPMLNAMGEERLARYASLLDAYGGELRYSTDAQDEGLIASRLQTIRDFLREAGVHTGGQVVREGIAGGEGMGASEAILIRTHEGTYDPEQAASRGRSESTADNGGGDQ